MFLNDWPQNKTLVFLFSVSVVGLVMWLVSTSMAVGNLNGEAAAKNAKPPASVAEQQELADNARMGQVVMLILAVVFVLAFAGGCVALHYGGKYSALAATSDE